MERREDPQASLELLILKTLSEGPNHGFGIALHIGRTSTGLLRVEEGSLYPALHRLEKSGYIEAEWPRVACLRLLVFEESWRGTGTARALSLRDESTTRRSGY